MPLEVAIRPTLALLRRSISRDRRRYKEGDAMDVCAQWRSKNWAGQHVPIYTRRGLLHITLCGHEGLRAVITRQTATVLRGRSRSWRDTWRKLLALSGVGFHAYKYTRRINLFFFTFCLSIEWCYKPSIEKVDPNDVARGNVNL